MQPFEPDPTPAPSPGHRPEFAPPAPAPALAHASEADDAIHWLKSHGRALLTTAVFFQVTVLLGMVAIAARPLLDSRSQTVLLRVGPVDPRDLFRGDYVILSYDVSRVSYPSSLEPGQTVYVPLELDKDGRHWHSQGAQATRPATGVFLRGTVTRPGLAEFGVERYFVPEGTGHDYENAVRSRRLWSELVVAPDGQARLNKLVVE